MLYSLGVKTTVVEATGSSPVVIRLSALNIKFLVLYFLISRRFAMIFGG
jgi:hypothetical protein